MNPHDVASIDLAELETWRAIGRPHAFIDVRERGEYALGQIPGACPLPRGLLEIRMELMVPWKDFPVVLYSNAEHRSRLAALTCRTLGYTDVRVFAGGVEGWVASGSEPVYGVNVLGKTFGEVLSVTDQVQQVEPDELARLIEEGAVVIDARTRSEYDKGHIPGAVHVPGGELVPQALRAGLDSSSRTQPVVVHCAGRTRSIVGAFLLSQAGLGDVHALRNGTMAWVMSGRELERAGRQELPREAAVGPIEAAAKARCFAAEFVGDTSARGLTVEEARALAEAEPVYFIDVRREDEFELGHLPGSVPCPAGQLANAVDELLPVRDAHLICYSGEQTRSMIGAGLLARVGYRSTYWLEGGLRAWRDADGPVVEGSATRYLDDLEFTDPETEILSPSAVARAVADGAVLLDVRRSSEYALCHVPGSTWVPRGDLERRIAAVGPAGTRLVVISDRGLRAALASSTLAELGYDSAVLGGGLTAWLEDGLAVEEGLEGADVSLREAKEDAELVARRPALLERNREDMERYLDWEERLGHALQLEKDAVG